MKAGEMLSAAQTRQWRRTLRLTFSYDGADIRLTGRRSVEMIPPAPTVPLPATGQSGFWYVVRDDKNEAFYYRVIGNPMPPGYEVFSPEGQSITNVDRQRAQGTFEILVPDTPEADNVSLFSSHPLAGGERSLKGESRQQPAREIARFSLRRETER